jgi:thiol:disulfide interchange protein DsbA
MNRRTITQALSLVPLSVLMGSHSVTQAAKAVKAADPKLPFRVVTVPEDGRRVIFFFDFACPFCAKYSDPLLTWSVGVPKSVQTMFIPVVNMNDLVRKKEQIIAAKCYYAAFQISSKGQMALFSNAVYAGYEKSRSLISKEMWAKAIRTAGIDAKRFGEALKSRNNDFQIQYAARKTAQYSLRVTPSVGVGGKYVLTPEDVLGDEVMFFNILNGLASEIL